MVISGSVQNVIPGVYQKYQDVHGVLHQDQQNRRHRCQHRKKMKRSKSKPKKLTSIPVLNRRLFKLASIVCRERAGFKCEICGMKKGDLYKCKPQRVEAHHVMSRSNKNSPLKWDIRNLICLCTLHHKTYKFSAHRHAIWFAEQFKKIRPDDYDWILEHSNDEVDLNDRTVLEIVEKCLKNNLPLDLEKYDIKYIKKGKYLHETLYIQNNEQDKQ